MKARGSAHESEISMPKSGYTSRETVIAQLRETIDICNKAHIDTTSLRAHLARLTAPKEK